MTVPDGEAAVGGIVMAAAVPVHRVRVRRPTLDDVFFHFTGRQIRAEAGDDLGGVRRLRRAVFAGQDLPAAGLERFPIGVEVFGRTLPLVGDLAVVCAFAGVFFVLAARAFGRPD